MTGRTARRAGRADGGQVSSERTGVLRVRTPSGPVMITLGPAPSGEGPRFARVRYRNIPARPEHIPVDAERPPAGSGGFARRGTGRVGAERERGEGERRVGPEKEAERRANVVLSPEKEA